MLAVLFAFLGVPIWLIVGLVALVLWNRHRLANMEGVFKFRGGSESGEAPAFGDKPTSGRANWVHDVLIVHKGIAFMRSTPIGVSEVIGRPEPVAGEKVKHLGEHPQSLRFRLDDGAVVRLVVPAQAADLAMGSFVPVGQA